MTSEMPQRFFVEFDPAPDEACPVVFADDPVIILFFQSWAYSLEFGGTHELAQAAQYLKTKRKIDLRPLFKYADRDIETPNDQREMDRSWQPATDINARSIGIELVNPGHELGYRAFPASQMRTLLDLLPAVVARHGIPPQRILGHSDVAPERKSDPGELFDWAVLARHGLGLWPSPDFTVSDNAPALGPGQAGPAVLNLQIALDAIGYGIEGTGLYDPVTEAVVTAFQRHFRPTIVDGVADPETTSLIHHLATQA